MTNHTPPTDDELAEMQARCDAATPGPWQSDGKVEDWLSGEAPGVAVWWHRGSRGSPVCMCQLDGAGRYGAGGTERPIEDAALIAACRTDLPRLLEDNKRLRAEVREHKDALRTVHELLKGAERGYKS